MAEQSVIMYELNEVPWRLVDEFVLARPGSNLARLLERGATWTTVNDDSAHLSPWRTWPTLHKSMYAADHRSYELGQDPATFRGENLWDVLDAAGLRVGTFGVLQSWPPRAYESGGFSVPDTFARDASTLPGSLETFQRFNLKMTSDNSYSSDSPLSAVELVSTGVDLVRKGLTVASATRLSRHLLQEKRDVRFKAARPMMQVVPAFDLFWRLQRRYRPRFSAFFTNHVAAMMHRYWGDAMPEYAAAYGYSPDPVYGTFLEAAMELADVQLGRIMSNVGPGSRLVVAASMGQGPTDHREDTSDLLVLGDGAKLAEFLGAGPGSQQLTMHPMCSIAFESHDAAERAAFTLGQVVDSRAEPLFETIEQQGSSVVFRTRYTPVSDDDPRLVRMACDPTRSATYSSIGLQVRGRLGGSNTAYHIPEGILIDYAPSLGVSNGDKRSVISALDVAPSMLVNVYGLEPPSSMKGSVDASLFDSRVS